MRARRLLNASREITGLAMPNMTAKESGNPPAGYSDSCVEILNSSEYGEWDALVDRSPHGTVFHNSWWLEAARSRFQILVCRYGRGIVAGIPICRVHRRGVRLLQRPALTPYLGPVVDVPEADPIGATSQALTRAAGEALAKAIADFDLLEYDVGPNAPDLQPFLWHGYRAERGHTFVVPSATPPEQALQRISRKQRARISNRHGLVVECGADFDSFFAVQRKTFAYKRTPVPFTEEYAHDLWSTACGRGCAAIYLARAAEGRVAAGLCVVHDRRFSYQLMAGVDPELRSLGAGPLLGWTALQDALRAHRGYDFEGSVFPGVAAYFRSMGATAVPIHTLSKAPTWRGVAAQWWLQWKYENHGMTNHR
jgi:hypothetical protein